MALRRLKPTQAGSHPPSDSDVARFLDRMKEKKIVWAQAGLPVEFRKGEPEFQAGIKTLPATAKALKRAGVERVGT